MTEIVLFHHAYGRTAGFTSFADQLRDTGHTVHTPDLLEGRTFSSLDEGVAYAAGVGVDGIIERGTAAVATVPHAVVYAGFSLGTLPAQALTQRCPGAVGALLFPGDHRPVEFGSPWPPGTPGQIHAMEHDPWIEPNSLEAFAREEPSVELCWYRGDGHLFADPTLDEYDAEAAAHLLGRVLFFLDGIGR